ncbi:MAG: type II secretion system protein GspG [Opitutae bacterium]|nr:type II secretion system protein GspG [Opitutae bacterium]
MTLFGKMRTAIIVAATWQLFLFLMFMILTPKTFSIGIDKVFWAQATGIFPPALERFHKDLGRYPTSVEGIEALRTPPSENGQGWKGPYIEPTLRPALGEKYFYRCPSLHAGFGYDFWIEYKNDIYSSRAKEPKQLIDRFWFRYSGFIAAAALIAMRAIQLHLKRLDAKQSVQVRF